MARLKGSKTKTHHTNTIREVTCIRCGKTIREPARAGNPNKKFCSAECRTLFRTETRAAFKEKTCAECGNIFMTSNPSRYCSLACAQARHRKTKQEKLATKREREKIRRKTNRTYAIKNRMRSLINGALKQGKGGERWQDLLGYTADDLRKHLQKQFKDGMTWERFLDGEIHIDHKIPIAVFNITSVNDIDFKRCFALSNLQLLWAHDNISKSAKIDKPFQPSLKLGVMNGRNNG